MFRHTLRVTLVHLALILATSALSACGMALAPSGAAPSGSVYHAAPAATFAPEPARRLSTGGSATVNGAAYDALFFKNYGVNPFIDTEDDHLSTFAMDVDTASYTVARNYVMEGHRPDPDSVRVEEFVNYFDYGYTPPVDGAAFAIHLAGAPSPFGGEKYSLLRVGLQGKVIDRNDRKDASLVFVIDVSGSMDMDNRLGLVKSSLGLLVDELRPTDEVGIVVYGSQARVVLQPTSAENRGEQILTAIAGLQSEGATNAEEGLVAGYRMAAAIQRPGRITRLILCSDGVANVGSTGPDAMLAQIKAHVQEGITLSTVGFGLGNYNDVLMEKLADDGNGNYAYVDTLAEARRIFVENLTGTLQVIAKDAKVQVDFNPSVVTRYRLLGYENRSVQDEEFRNDTIDAGEVGAGHRVTALYEVKFAAEGEGNVATVHVRTTDPETGEVTESSRNVARADFAPDFLETDLHFQLAALVAEYAEILRESYWAQDGSLAAVREMALGVAAQLDEDRDVAEFAFLVSRVEGIGR